MDFITDFYNIFLTRNPKKMIASYIKEVSKITLKDTGYKEQYLLLENLVNQNKHPVVVDSKQLLKDPKDTLKKICIYCKIPFSKKMLQWRKGPIKEDGIWSKYWYKNVHNSTGFIPYNNKKIELPSKYNLLLKQCNKYYNLMLKHSL